MTSTIPVKPKKRGRPATGRDPLLTIRAPAGLVERVDKWAATQAGHPSRSEAIRRLIEKALGQIGFIDPPSYFAPIQEWREFQLEMERAIGRIDGAEEHVSMAKRVIAEKEAERA